jgi:hypothetical protein
VPLVEPEPIKTAISEKGRACAADMEERLGTDAVEHVLPAGRPKLRCLVDAPSKVVGALTRALPDKALGRVMRAMDP